MNKKGFTLIELLAVIVIMGIVLVIAVPNSIDAYKKSRLKTEETFVKRLSQMVDSYVTLNSEELTFSSYSINGNTEFDKRGQEKKVTVGIDRNITVNNLIEENLISTGDYINPNNKGVTCNTNASIEIYKDSDFVYCHKIKALSLECITDDYIEYIEENYEKEDSNYVQDGNPYIINTCVWSDN